jgi:soluble lytic murein transglycosylase-like protein/tetratricopeptide (TPR) repeat protein
MPHNSAEGNPNFGYRDTMDSSSFRKTKRCVDREISIALAVSLGSRQDFRDDTILKYVSGSSTEVESLRRVLFLVTLALLLSLSSFARADSVPPADNTFLQGWSHLSEEKFAEARETFGGISPDGYDLGDYVLYFTGIALAKEGNAAKAAATLDRLSGSFPESPLVPYLTHELAFAAAKGGDIPSARKYFEASRGKITGNGRMAAEGYIAAILMEERGKREGKEEGEEEGKEEERNIEGKKPAEAHLENFSSYTVQEGAVLSMDRLWEWRQEGKLSEWGLPVSFYGKYAKALFRAGEDERARAVFQEALEKFSPSDDYYDFLLDYAEFLRKQGETSEARSLLVQAMKDAPAPFRSEVEFLFARVEWKAGRIAEARRKFLEIAESEARQGTAERARYQAAWIAEEEENWKAATEQFGKLTGARNERVRRESVFRYAFGLYKQKRYADAIAAFEAGEKKTAYPVEQARHVYWKARALAESGEKQKGDVLLRMLAADHGAGPYAIFSSIRLGRDPFGMLNAPSSGETIHCAGEKEKLWETIRGATWSVEDAEKVRRAERLTLLGLIEYAILEAERVDRSAIRKATGLADGGTPGLFRYLAGDLRGAIRETIGIPSGRSAVELIDRLQYPLAPQYLGDCDGKKSGVDSLVLHSLIRQESLFQYNALSSAGAVGLMQLMPRTAAEVARKEKIRKKLRRSDLLKPEVNVALGAAYFANLLRGYDNDYVRAIAAYNAGELAVARWWKRADGDPAMFLERVTYRETRSYLRRFFFNLLQYYRIYRPEMLARYFPSDRTEGGTVPEPSASPPAAGTPGGEEGNNPPGTEASGDENPDE